jgi:hypothetical protein
MSAPSATHQTTKAIGLLIKYNRSITLDHRQKEGKVYRCPHSALSVVAVSNLTRMGVERSRLIVSTIERFSKDELSAMPGQVFGTPQPRS